MANESIKNEDFDIMCRICLQRSDDRIDLFSSLAGYSMISNAVMECAPIQITYGDNLPNTICQNCIVQLDVAYRFRVLCIQSDLTLRQFLTSESSTLSSQTQSAITSILLGDKKLNTSIDDEVKLEKSDNESIHSNYNDDIKDEIMFPDNNDDDIDNDNKTSLLTATSDLINDNDIKVSDKLKVVKVKKSLSNVNKKKQQKDKRKFECNNCYATFKRNSHLKRHQRRCLIDNDTVDDNGKNFTLYVTKNVSKVNENEEGDENETIEPAETKQIKIKLKPYATFKENIEREANGRYSCRICNKTYKSKYHTARHAIVHSDYRFRCPHCDKCFVRPASLREHINVHTGKRGYNCEFCGKIFRTDSALNTHRRIHLGVRPYKCHVCERTFTQNKTLKNHMRTHTGERPFVCETCGRSFNRKHILKTHTMIHTGERPYRCDICLRTFICKQHLQLHLIKHTGEPQDQLRCNICDKRFTTHACKIKHLHDIHQITDASFTDTSFI